MLYMVQPQRTGDTGGLGVSATKNRRNRRVGRFSHKEQEIQEVATGLSCPTLHSTLCVFAPLLLCVKKMKGGKLELRRLANWASLPLRLALRGLKPPSIWRECLRLRLRVSPLLPLLLQLVLFNVTLPLKMGVSTLLGRARRFEWPLAQLTGKIFFSRFSTRFCP